jgi:LysR family glycine cleavage system transcriptional activator
MGVGLGQREYIADDIAAGRLIVPFNIPLQRKGGFYLVYPLSHRHLPKVAAFRDWVLAKRSPPVTSPVVPISRGRKLVA